MDRTLAAAAATAIGLLLPVMAGVAVSVAVIVRFPAVVSVAWRVFTPFTRLLSAGSVPLVSVLVKCTIPV